MGNREDEDLWIRRLRGEEEVVVEWWRLWVEVDWPIGGGLGCVAVGCW